MKESIIRALIGLFIFIVVVTWIEAAYLCYKSRQEIVGGFTMKNAIEVK